MSTHALVFVPDSTHGMRGRYVHFDGYPDGLGATLLRLVARDGFDKVRDVLIDSQAGWVSVTGARHQLEFDEKGTANTIDFHGDNGDVVTSSKGEGLFVVGYGEPTNLGDLITTSSLDEAPFWEWAYLLASWGMLFTRYCSTAEELKWIGNVPLSTRPIDFADIADVAESLLP